LQVTPGKLGGERQSRRGISKRKAAAMNGPIDGKPGESTEAIRVHGRVQGVGYRQAVVQLAQGHGLRGWVANETDGTVALQVSGAAGDIEAFVQALPRAAAPLSRVDRIERTQAEALPPHAGFRIVSGRPG
jgi:acylphosphatase